MGENEGYIIGGIAMLIALLLSVILSIVIFKKLRMRKGLRFMLGCLSQPISFIVVTIISRQN